MVKQLDVLKRTLSRLCFALVSIAFAIDCSFSLAQDAGQHYQEAVENGTNPPVENNPVSEEFAETNIGSHTEPLGDVGAENPAEKDPNTEHADLEQKLEADIGKRTNSFWDNVDINGHIRVRHETDWQRINRPTRNRGRLRARLAFTWIPNEEFDAGIRWTTGDRKIVLDPEDRTGSPLSYQDFGDVYDKFELNLDRIFITYKPQYLPNSFATFGKFRFPGKVNPLFEGPIGDLVFDEAVQPEGVAAGHTWHPNFGVDEVKFTVAETVLLEQSNADEASMLYLQAWAKKNCGPMSIEGGIGWFDWHNLNPDGSTRISFENNFGNEVTQVGPGPEDVIFTSGFSILNPMLVLTYDDCNACDRLHPLQFIWESFHNLDSFDDQRDTGYSIGVQYGPSVTSRNRERGDWKVYYSWNDVEQESVFTPVAQDDWLRATNFQGHWLGADYNIRKNIELRLWVLGDLPILPVDGQGQVDTLTGTREQEWRGRIDLTVYY